MWGSMIRRAGPGVVVVLAVAGAPVQAAEGFAAAGTKGTLSVDYVYESTGKKSSEGQYDPYAWRVRRSASLVAQLAAQPATASPTVQAIDTAQMAALQGKAVRAQAMTTQMAPMMAGVNEIMARCGNDEACISRETQKMGFAMQGTPEMAAELNARKSVQDLSRPDAARYQAWRAVAQKGSYRIDESVQVSVTDPICANRPRHRCTRDEQRTGTGEIAPPAGAKSDPAAAAGLSAVEIDSARHTLTVSLPVPLLPLAYTETITTDEPEGTHDTPTPKGPQARQHRFRVNAAGDVTHDRPFTVPLKGDWRSQSGEQVVMLKGELGDAGRLTVRWRFTAP